MTSEATRASTPAIIVGLMSGTSLDGVSAAVARVGGDPVRAELIAFVQRPYTRAQRARILHAIAGATPAEYTSLHADMGEWLASAAVEAIAEAGVARTDLAAVASHGQTIWHQPGVATWQLGDAAVIAERTGLPVIYDFRSRDMAAGGQGAPLVPIADALLWHGTRWRALQNIGGMANVTIVPPGGDTSGVRAFDTGPGMAITDAVTRLLRPELPFDRDGTLASAGMPIVGVVSNRLADAYFAADPPKSTGREKFGTDYAGALIADCRAADERCRDEDIIATAVALTADSIADAFARFIPEPVAEVVVSGGGARNAMLMRALTIALAPRAVRRFTDDYFDGEAKEAVAFALLGWLHLRGRPGNIPSATGARGPRVLGALAPA